MTYFKNVENGNIYRISNTGTRVYWRYPGQSVWFLSEAWRPADLSGYPFIAVKSTNC